MTRPLLDQSLESCRAVFHFTGPSIFALEARRRGAVRIGHMEVAFSPRGILWNLWIESPALQMIPEVIHIGDVEDKPSPASTVTA